MNERQAMAQGLHYTGMSFDRWDTRRANDYANDVKEFKKKYNVRLVKVSQSNGFYSYYGDDNFMVVQYNTIENLQARLDRIPDRIAKARQAFDDALAEIEKDRQATIEKMNKVKEIMK